MRTLRACPNCGARVAEWLHGMSFALPDSSPLPSRYDLVACQVCGCAFADSTASEADYIDYYRDFSRYEEPAIASGGGEQPSDRLRLDDLAGYLSRHVALTGRIADVGAGNGGLLVSLRKLGYRDLTGFDPSPVCVDHMQKAGLDARVWVFPMTSTGEPMGFDARYDLIILSHVLEHVYDARALVAALRNLLATDGKLYIEVPDPTGYLDSSFPPFYFFDPEHINHFGESSLKHLANSLGLSVLEFGKKGLRLANGATYPALYGLFKQGGETAASVGSDRRVREALTGYIQASREQLSDLRARILSLAHRHPALAVWGAGSLSQRLMSEDWFPRDRLVAIVDRDSKKVGLNFMGLCIQSPDAGLSGLPEGTVVCCAAAIAGEQIVRDYQSMGLPYPFVNIVTQDCGEA